MNAVQLSLTEAMEDQKRERPEPCLYDSPARGIAAREAEFAAWKEEHGRFGSAARSHAWHVSITHRESPTSRCQPTALSADTRAPDARYGGARYPVPCECQQVIDSLMYRGACTGCDWEGESRTGENPAAEDAHDHAWPGWRDLPTVPKVPEWTTLQSKKERQARDRWLAIVIPVHPPGWLEAGGPIRTLRQPMGTRHVPFATPWGGYDMAVITGEDLAS